MVKAAPCRRLPALCVELSARFVIKKLADTFGPMGEAPPSRRAGAQTRNAEISVHPLVYCGEKWLRDGRLGMAIDKVKAYLRERGMDDRVLEFETSSATVELAAAAVGCEPARIAKTLSFHVGERVALVVAAGDARIDNAKFKARFGCKAKMLKAEEAEPLIGHGVGGVCPFAVNDDVDVYLDESLRRFDTVYPAAGSAASAVRLAPDELERCAEPCTWVDVCKLP